MATTAGGGYHGTVVDTGGNTFVLNKGTAKITKNGADSVVPKTPTEIFFNGDSLVYCKSVDGVWYKYNGSAWVVSPIHPRDM